MKNKTGIIIGFFAGMIGFLLAFKVLVINHTTPDDELAPGMVVILSLISGAAFAFAGHLLQQRLVTKK